MTDPSTINPRRKRYPVAMVVLGVLAYLPLLLSAPGKIPGDTKLYLYLDPWRLITDSIWTWDNRQLGGWVPHQNIGYLWPTGPWFAGWEAIGIPDWVAHRLWLGTMLASAGIGTLWLARRLGLGIHAAFIAALAYQLSPYVLPYISRTSALLLPWALLPWLCGVAIAVAWHRRWRDILLFALLVFSSGGLNATALLMIAPAPIIYMVHLWRNGSIDGKRLFSALSALGVTSFLVSAWWLTGLAIQGRYGAAVLSYSEALPSTAATSSAPEVLRGLGYWLFYDRNDIVSLTSASTPYQGNLIVMGAGGALVLIGLWGIMRSTAWRWALMTSVLFGTVLAVGAFPFSDPSPLWRLAVEHPRQAFSLALRSSSRAVPVVTLALALGVGLAVQDIFSRVPHFTASRRRQVCVLAGVMTLIALNLPALFGGRLIDPVMTRPNDLPSAWYDAARYLDQRFDDGHTGSVLLLPGIESAAYRWGYAVDPILPGLTKKPLISRDWLPLGSAPLMDLVFALDDSFQSGTARAEAVAPVARLLGADTVMVVNTHQYERFGTVRPERARSILGSQPPDLRYLASFGPPLENRAPAVTLDPLWSEELVALPFQKFPEIELYAVENPTSGARTSTAPVLIAGDGTGLVDLAAAGVVDGDNLFLSEAGLTDDELKRVLQSTPELLITDSNRRRAHHWRSSQDVWGATESLNGVLVGEDLFDARLPVFPNGSASSQSIVVAGQVEAKASSYGPELTFSPEHRPAMALDGDQQSAWRVGTHTNPIGEILRVTANDRKISRLTLVQPLDPNPLRWISTIDISLDGGPWTTVQLDARSRTATGQVHKLNRSADTVTIRIAAIEWVEPLGLDTGPGVGFAEVLDSDFVSPEVIELPRRTHNLGTEAPATSFLFQRLRAEPFARWRQDPELTMERQFLTSRTAEFSPAVTLRLSHRAAEPVLRAALGIGNTEFNPPFGANERLQGRAAWWGLSALDGNSSTVWWTASRLDLAAADAAQIVIPLSGPVTTLALQQVRDQAASRITKISIDIIKNGSVLETFPIDLPEPDENGRSQFSLPGRAGDLLVMRLTEIESTLVRDEATGLTTAAPVGIIDISSDGWEPVQVQTRFDTDCRNDLLAIDNQPLSLRLQGTVQEVLSGDPIEAQICGNTTIDLAPGSHRLSTISGLVSGWDIDTVILRDTQREAAVESTPATTTIDRGWRLIEEVACPTSCWLEVADGWNQGWVATVDGDRLGPSLASAGGRNVWFIETNQLSNTDGITLTWTPQRAMWWAVALTIGTVLFLIIAAVIEKWRRSKPGSLTSAQREPIPVSSAKNPSLTADVTTLRQSTVVTRSAPWIMLFLTFVVGLLVISPVWALILTATVALFRNKPRLLRGIGGGLVGLGMLFLLAQQIRTGADPGFGWPSVFIRAHRPTLAGLVLLWVAVTAADVRRSARDKV